MNLYVICATGPGGAGDLFLTAAYGLSPTLAWSKHFASREEAERFRDGGSLAPAQREQCIVREVTANGTFVL
jgi:hypothetical protein